MITNMKQIEKKINGRIALAMKITQQQVYKVIQRHIALYYEEKVFTNNSAIPSEYKRTYQFLNSLIKTDIISTGNGISCKVMIDTDSLNYYQPGEVVVDMINRGFHSDTMLAQSGSGYEYPPHIEAESHFWDDAINELGGYNGILQIFKNSCKKVGLPIQ